MDFISKCEICGKEYDSYMRTFFVQNSNDESSKKCCCRECLSKEAVKNHIDIQTTFHLFVMVVI